MITTTVKRIAALALLLAVLAVPALALAAPAAADHAAPLGRDERVALARESCQQAAEDGFLDELGLTFGECLNIVSGPASEQAANFVAGFCGFDFIQEEVGATTKGQCIKVVREIFGEQR